MTYSALLLCLQFNSPSIPAHIGGIFVTPNKKISISETFPREHLTTSYNKKSTICYTYVVTPFSSSSALTYLVSILFLQTNSWKLAFATVNKGLQQEQVNIFVMGVIFHSSQSHRSSISQSCLDAGLTWKKSPHIRSPTCL